jgi:hypothetical protein
MKQTRYRAVEKLLCTLLLLVKLFGTEVGFLAGVCLALTI